MTPADSKGMSQEWEKWKVLGKESSIALSWGYQEIRVFTFLFTFNKSWWNISNKERLK